MSGRDVRAYLDELCRQLDEGTLQARLRRVAVATAVPVSMLVSGCAVDEYGAPVYGVPMYGVVTEEQVCNDGIDDNGDGLTDCEDPVCHSIEYCLGCDDGIDNDDNGDADCTDETCEPAEECQ